MARPVVRVEIMGQVFTVTGEEGEEHLREVARLVDAKMREVSRRARLPSALTVAVLAALNIASECEKLKRDTSIVMERIERLTARIDATLGK